ncbi:hypothetical protein TRFO_43020 [Tritrichomonas foetus]|uniref:Uncharacterized protein n=1 Tax=Tritrichomonas foetus TaxID=1144522 RepID=A0A1J4KT96_9EUKA|nr:hypothetical protein TRFO_43020 [Tritrichomonas foetus]|eukprot:OHT14505.1 hypothetical protein TRFO_43020 [Tritrichomonas foetus]
MSVRETPVSNRICDLKDKERAYKKHLEALANAKTTLDTHGPDAPNRLKVKAVNDQRYRRQLKSDYSKREKMLREVDGSQNGSEYYFPDDYDPEMDDDDVNIDSLMKRYNDNADILVPMDSPAQQKIKTESIKIGYSNNPEIEYEDDEELNDTTEKNRTPSKRSETASRKSNRSESKIPIAKKSPAAVSKGHTNSPQCSEKVERLNVNSSKKVGFSPNSKIPARSKNSSTPKSNYPDFQINISSIGDGAILGDNFDDDGIDLAPKRDSARPVTPSKSNGRPGTASKTGHRPSRPTTANEPESSRRSRPGTASSTRTFDDDFEDDFETSSTFNKTGNSNFNQTGNSNFSTSGNLENFDDDNFSSTIGDLKNKTLCLAEIDTSATEPMQNTGNLENQNSDGIPDLDLPDF